MFVVGAAALLSLVRSPSPLCAKGRGVELAWSLQGYERRWGPGFSGAADSSFTFSAAGWGLESPPCEGLGLGTPQLCQHASGSEGFPGSALGTPGLALGA